MLGINYFNFEYLFDGGVSGFEFGKDNRGFQVMGDGKEIKLWKNFVAKRDPYYP